MSRSFEDRGGRSPLIIKDLDLYPQPPLNTRSPTLNSEEPKILVDAYEAACQRSVTGALPGYSGSWRRHITHSAQMLARVIAEPDYPWSGVAWR